MIANERRKGQMKKLIEHKLVVGDHTSLVALSSDTEVAYLGFWLLITALTSFFRGMFIAL